MSLLNAVLAVVSGAALIASFPKANLWPLAWVALVPLFIVYRRSSLRESLLATAVMAVVFFAGLLYWIALFGYAPWIMLSLFQAAFLMIFCFVAYPAFRPGRENIRLLLVPAAWTAVEWLRSLGTFGFTWGDLAQSQTLFLPMIQMGSVTGPWGISFVIVAFNVAVSECLVSSRILAAHPLRLRQSPFLRLVVVTIAVAAIALLGRQCMTREYGDGQPVKVAIIQANIDQEMRLTESWDSYVEHTATGYTSLTMEALEERPDIVIWPETAIPGHFTKPDGLKWMIEALARVGQVNMLVGATDVTSNDGGRTREHNGAYLFDSNGEMTGSYFKTHLVPFGEFVPGREWLPFLQKYNVRKYDVAPGGGHHPLKSDIGNLGVMICFESVFPRISRTLVSRGADFLVVMTNDAWFERTSAAEQHYAMAVLRAVENRRYVARAAATGISAIIEPTGRVRKSAGIFRGATLTGDVISSSHMTLYSRFGDWLAYLCIVVVGVGYLAFARTDRAGA